MPLPETAPAFPAVSEGGARQSFYATGQVFLRNSFYGTLCRLPETAPVFSAVSEGGARQSLVQSFCAASGQVFAQLAKFVCAQLL